MGGEKGGPKPILVWFRRVSYLGLNSLFGRVTTNLLKQSPCIHKLSLYDDGAPHGIEHPNVFFGRDSLQDAIKDVNIVVIGDEGGGPSEEDRLKIIGPKIIRYSEAIIKFSPNAIVIVAASPLNVLFPLIGNFLGPDWQNRLLGTTSVDTLRASRTLDGLLNEQNQTHILPIIGGTSYSTRVPLFSHVCPQIDISDDIRNKILRKMDMCECSEYEEMDAIERAYTTVRFIHSVLASLTRDISVPEIAMTKTSRVPHTNYFSLPILIGRKGVERAVDLPQMDANEEKLFFEAAKKLSEEAKKAAEWRERLSRENNAEDVKKPPTVTSQGTDHEGTKSVERRDSSSLSRTRSRSTSARKRFLEMPCAEAAPTSLENSRQASKTDNQKDCKATTGLPNILKEELMTELKKEATVTKTQRKDESQCEETDDMSETLQLEVEEHLNSMKQPQSMSEQSKSVEMVSVLGAKGMSDVQSWGASNQYLMSRTNVGSSGPAKTSNTAANTPSTHIRRIDKAIVHSKTIKSKQESAKLVEKRNASSEKINKAIMGSNISSVRESEIESEKAPREEENNERLLRQEGNDTGKIYGQKVESHLPAKDTKREMRPSTNTQDVEVKTHDEEADDILAEKLYDQKVESHSPSRETKREMRPPKNSQDVEVKPRDAGTSKDVEIKTRDAENAIGVEATPLVNAGKKIISRLGRKDIETADSVDANGELKPRKESDRLNSRESNQKAVQKDVRGKVNSKVLETFEREKGPGNRLTKSFMMMMKRKQLKEERVLGDNGEQAKETKSEENENEKTDVIQVDGEIGTDGEVLSSRTAKLGRRGLPFKRMPEKRKHRGKKRMAVTERKRKTDDEVPKENKELSVKNERTSEASSDTYRATMSSMAPRVSSSPSKRINTAISEMRARKLSRRPETKDGPQRSKSLSVASVKRSKSLNDSSDNRSKSLDNASAKRSKSSEDSFVKRSKSSDDFSVKRSKSSDDSSVKRSKSSDDSTVKRSSTGDSLPSKRIDSTITNNTTPSRQRSPSPKAVNFKSFKKSDVSNHLLTDAGRMAKLNSLHKSDLFNIEKIPESKYEGIQPNDKVDEGHQKPKKNKTQASPGQFKHEKNLPKKLVDETETEDNKLLVFSKPKKDLTVDKTMNYFMRHRTKGSDKLNESEQEEKLTVKLPKQKQPPSRKSKRKKRKHLQKPPKDAIKGEKKLLHTLNNGNKPDKVAHKKEETTKKEEELEIEDPWDSKYFTKASEKFFKMFRDSVTSKPPIVTEGTEAKSQDLLLGTLQKGKSEIEENALSRKTEEKTESQSVEATKPNNSTNTVERDQSTQKTAGAKEMPGKISIRFEKSADVKRRAHSEGATKNSELCEKVLSHVSTRSQQPNLRCLPIEQKQEIGKNAKEETPVNIDKLYEESSTVPVVTGKVDNNWRSMETTGSARASTSGVLQGVVATSDKGRGDAMNKVDFTVSKVKDQKDLQKGTHNSVESKGAKQTEGTLKIPISSMTIKQVVTNQVQKKPEEAPKPEKTYKWARIVSAFKNIIVNDIEGARPKTFLDTVCNNLAPSNTDKPVAPPKTTFAPKNKPGNKLASHGTKTGLSKAKSMELAKKKKHETAKNIRPKELPKGFIIKNNPKKIVNYFSKRGASASTYERPTFDRQFINSEGLLSQTANMGQNNTSFAFPPKIK